LRNALSPVDGSDEAQQLQEWSQLHQKGKKRASVLCGQHSFPLRTLINLNILVNLPEWLSNLCTAKWSLFWHIQHSEVVFEVLLQVNTDWTAQEVYRRSYTTSSERSCFKPFLFRN
jgi:hypothetical protein